MYFLSLKTQQRNTLLSECFAYLKEKQTSSKKCCVRGGNLYCQIYPGISLWRSGIILNDTAFLGSICASRFLVTKVVHQTLIVAFFIFLMFLTGWFSVLLISEKPLQRPESCYSYSSCFWVLFLIFTGGSFSLPTCLYASIGNECCMQT